MRQFTCPRAVTRPSTNRARCRATALIETNALPLHQTANMEQSVTYLLTYCTSALVRLLLRAVDYVVVVRLDRTPTALCLHASDVRSILLLQLVTIGGVAPATAPAALKIGVLMPNQSGTYQFSRYEPVWNAAVNDMQRKHQLLSSTAITYYYIMFLL